MTYDASTALLLVDIQNDFADAGGSLYVKGGEEVAPVANREIAAALTGGALVIYSQDWHPPQTPHFRAQGGVWPAHCVRDTWGSRFVPTLRVAGPVIQKGAGGEDGYSAFSVRDFTTGATLATELESILRERGITRLVILGLATDYCVLATSLDARRLGFEVTVPLEGVRAVDLEPGDGQRALDQMARAGVTLAPAPAP